MIGTCCKCDGCGATCDGEWIDHDKHCIAVDEPRIQCECEKRRLRYNERTARIAELTEALAAADGRIETLERDGGRLFLAVREVVKAYEAAVKAGHICDYTVAYDVESLRDRLVELMRGPLFYQRKGPLKP
jgi:hypothetical protein